MSVEFNLSNVIKAPVISEKGTNAAENENRFVFKVANEATKLQVKKSVELMFKVEVEKVQLLNVKGKAKRFGRFMGKRPDWKKAYVKLKEGHDIDFTAA
ncbi:MAG: 50S ribosomal protein L23 [Methyloprofundus sp.]|nr:50S ribosomal protein L23 [Methyloprofundus sp.]